ncbi:hypothetical protein A2U01_0066238 [Trifolium medium]|uniref:Uncharacterized protein n=1 Tax=Trifolium medium TaxID=97028 RepID=A0A392S8I3_9FABA|nr:hypothetical protein [Trifolium medium]
MLSAYGPIAKEIIPLNRRAGHNNEKPTKTRSTYDLLGAIVTFNIRMMSIYRSS